MTFARSTFVAAAAALTLLAGASAIAHTTRHGDGPRHEQMAQRMAERQDQLKTALKLKPNQEAAWTQYVNAHQPPARGTPPDRDAWAKLTTPERLDRMQAHKAERDAHMAKIAEATRALYATLDAEQQKVFDTQGPMARMGKGGRHDGERGMHGKPGQERGGMRQGS